MTKKYLQIKINPTKQIGFLGFQSADSLEEFSILSEDFKQVIFYDFVQSTHHFDEVDVIVIATDLNEKFSELINLQNKTVIRFQDLVDQNDLEVIDEVCLTEIEANKKEKRNINKLVQRLSILFFVFFIGYGFATMIPVYTVNEFLSVIPNEFYIMLAVGFFAQMVDGALGLGYGMTSAAAMMSMGVKLPAISGSIHTAEMFSSAISGYSHYKFGNVNKKMLIWLAIPGVVGAILGSLFVIYIGEEYEHYAYPFVALYLFIIAIRLLAIAFKNKIVRKKIKRIGLLGFSGGFFDAFGGGGWGPIVTSTLLTKGRQSKYVVGTVSLAEFFITFAATMTFFTSLGVEYWYIVLGLIIGGMLAAPIAAKLTGKLPRKLAYVLVALLVMISSIRIIIKLI